MKVNVNLSNKIPEALIYSRLVLGLCILGITIISNNTHKEFIVILILIGFLTDVFDGVVARKLNIDTDYIRRLDSKIDRIFWILVLVSAYLMYPGFIIGVIPKVALIFAFEFMALMISYIRFKKIPAPHNYLSKLWGCLVLISLCEITLKGYSNLLFNAMIVIGIISRIDSIFIYSILKNWERDIPTSYHAFQIRNGKKVKRTKLFN